RSRRWAGRPWPPPPPPTNTIIDVGRDRSVLVAVRRTYRNQAYSARGVRSSSGRSASSLARLLEISQIGRRLVLLGRHQEPIPAQEIVLLADGDLPVAFGNIILRPDRTRIRVAHVFLVDGPRARQGMVD